MVKWLRANLSLAVQYSAVVLGVGVVGGLLLRLGLGMRAQGWRAHTLVHDLGWVVIVVGGVLAGVAALGLLLGVGNSIAALVGQVRVGRSRRALADRNGWHVERGTFGELTGFLDGLVFKVTDHLYRPLTDITVRLPEPVPRFVYAYDHIRKEGSVTETANPEGKRTVERAMPSHEDEKVAREDVRCNGTTLVATAGQTGNLTERVESLMRFARALMAEAKPT